MRRKVAAVICALSTIALLGTVGGMDANTIPFLAGFVTITVCTVLIWLSADALLPEPEQWEITKLDRDLFEHTHTSFTNKEIIPRRSQIK